MLRLLISLALLLCLPACKHPLAIVGEGDIVDLNGSGRGCTLEEFQQGALNCTENEASGDYFVRYQAQPRAGWRFVRWDGPCTGDKEGGFCEFETVAALVNLWDTHYPELVPPASTAVFEPIGNPDNGVGFAALDAALATKTVSADSVEGLWMFYSDGSVNSQSELIPGTSAVTETTVHLWAFLVSVHLIELNGEPRILVAGCSRSAQSNTGFSPGMAFNPDSRQFDITLQQLSQWGGTLEPYAPGDASSSLYRDMSTTVTLMNNTEMHFADEYSYTDDAGLFTGGFTTRYKARKVNDDSFATLGQFEVNGQMGDSHCFSYSNFEEHQESTTGDGGISIADVTAEKFNVVSFPDHTLGRSDFLYQTSISETSFNGIPSPAQSATAVSLVNTRGMYSVQVNSASPGSQADIVVSLSNALELSTDYAISAAGSSDTFMGVIEALPHN